MMLSKLSAGVNEPKRALAPQSEEFPFQSHGRLVYDPKRGTMERNTKWWCVVQVDRGLAAYLRALASKVPEVEGNRLRLYNLLPPTWPPHISVVRGEQPRNRENWRLWDGSNVTFDYSNHVMRVPGVKNERVDFWVVHVQCETAMAVREALGLKTHHSFHLTVGITQRIVTR